MNRIPIAVVGLTDGPEAAAGVSLLQCLPPHRFLRIGIIADATEAGAHQPRLLDKVAHLPVPSDSSFLPAMLDVVVAFGVRVIVPGTTAIAQDLQAYAADFAARGAVVLAATGAAQMDQRLMVAAAHASLPMVERVAIEQADEVAQHPFCLSGLLQNDRGLRKKCFDSWQALRAVEKLQANHIWLSPWDSQNAFEAVVIPNQAGQILASGTVRIIADDDNSRPWMAVSMESAELDALLQRACLELQLDGPAHFLLQRSHSQFKIAAVHAGFPMWMEITRAAGPDLLGVAVELALGEVPAAIDRIQRLPAGILFSQSAEDLVLNDQHPLAAQLKPSEK
jgi:hypothetical protein